MHTSEHQAACAASELCRLAYEGNSLQCMILPHQARTCAFVKLARQLGQMCAVFDCGIRRVVVAVAAS